MSKLSELLKDELGKYNNFLQVAVGVLTTLAGISGLAINIMQSKLSIALVCIGFFFIVRRICCKVETNNKVIPGIATEGNSIRLRKIASYIGFISFSFWIFPLYCIVSFIAPKKKSCTLDQGIGLLIANFSNKKDDEFSYKLFDKLASDLPNPDSINLVRVDSFLEIKNLRYTDTLNKMLEDACSHKGLIVYGRRSEESKLFDCNIYIHNLNKIKLNDPQVYGKAVIYIQNPDLINFSIESQSATISDFILGLLYFNSKNNASSNEKFTHALQLNGNTDNKKFAAYCQLYIGNNYLLAKDFENASQAYKKGIACDSTNPYLHYNLATALLAKSSSKDAQPEYAKAKSLDQKLDIPIFDSIFVRPPPGTEKSFVAHIIQKDTISSKRKPPDEKDKIPDTTMQKSDYRIVCKNGKFGLASSKNDTLVKCEYDSIYQREFDYKERSFFIAEKSLKFGAIDISGKIVIPFNHPSAERVISVIQILMDSGAL